MSFSRFAAVVVMFTGLCLGGCAGRPAPAAPGPDVQALADWMEGSFSSRQQSLEDPEFFDISLRMKRIWTDRADGPWLYVEQARADLPDKPYRQRVYRVSTDPAAPGEFRSDVYTLPEPVSRFTGAWTAQGPAADAIAANSPSDLRLLDGCTVVLRYDRAADEFTGGTVGRGCASTRQGAAYTTSQISLRRDLLTSWDRGFDADDRQVWGAVKSGYRFVRVVD